MPRGRRSNGRGRKSTSSKTGRKGQNKGIFHEIGRSGGQEGNRKG